MRACSISIEPLHVGAGMTFIFTTKGKAQGKRLGDTPIVRAVDDMGATRGCSTCSV